MIAVLAALLSFVPVWPGPGQSNSQAPKDARLAVTVVDQTGAVIPNAKVTVTPVSGGAMAPATTNDKGIAVVIGLAPGRYTIEAEFPGFATRVLKDVPLKAGEQTRRRARHPGAAGFGDRVARRARGGVGPASHVRHGDDAGAD